MLVKGSFEAYQKGEFRELKILLGVTLENTPTEILL